MLYEAFAKQLAGGWRDIPRYARLQEEQDLVRSLPNVKIKEHVYGGIDARRSAIEVFGFFVVTGELVEALKKLAGPIIEVGSGNGYVAWELQQAGLDVIATDLEPGEENGYGFTKHWTEVEKLDAVSAVKKYPDRDLMLIWPNDYNSSTGWSDEVLSAYKGNLVIYAGEGQGGCTGSDRFHDLLWEEWETVKTIIGPTWDGIRDYTIIKKRKEE